MLEILKYPHPLLSEVSSPVEEIDREVLAFIDELIETMKASPGVGLAAPQVGVMRRIVVVDVTPRHPGHGLLVLVNPEIIEKSGAKRAREGCLSVPEYTANITRAKEVIVRALTPGGDEKEIRAAGFEAVCIQHELDHLDGILFIDRITNMKRDLFRRKSG